MRKLFSILAVALLTIGAGRAKAQTTLFEYPIAPDTCTTLESRCNYLVQHFWDKCDLTRPIDSSNDSLLVVAMADYIEIMRAGANINVTLSSIRNLMFKAQTQQNNFLKLISAAELLLYMHPVPIIDDIYLTFANCAAEASWAKKDYKEHFRNQVKQINNTKLGSPVTDFDVTLTDGTKTKFRNLLGPESNFLLVTYSDTDGSFERTRLYTDIRVKQAIDDGKLKIINIVAGDTPKKWDDQSLEYASQWTVGASKDIMDLLDIRQLPGVTILDGSGNVQLKNLTIDYVKGLFE